ncbi:MAG: 2-hydroxyacyl-CoA dehydratase [Methylocystaceae bacterium]
MRVSFPHMGNMDITLAGLFDTLGTEMVMPPPITRRTLELGTQYSPEAACLPFKLNIGNFIEAMEQGADTLVMLGGWGPCRLGYYAQVERDILKNLGYQFNMVVIEAPDSNRRGLLEVVKPLGNGATTWQALKGVKFAWKKTQASDELEKTYYRVLPYCRYPDLASADYQQARSALLGAKSQAEVNQVLQDYKITVEKAVKVYRNPIRIAVIGEIYTILEPFANFHIQERLARMGVSCERSLYMSEWLNDHLLGGCLPGGSSKPHARLADPYLPCWVGGHGKETVGYAISFARQGFDGIIQVGPLTCMPEIVAQAILPQVSKDEQIPLMSLWVDEQTGEAGLQTRLEAFVDMVERKERRGGLGGF